jgi:FAD/FMN-containing dehydrogenase
MLSDATIGEFQKSVRVDPASQTVRVDAGCTSGDVDHATHPFGLAVPFGIVSTTGVAGLTLGGGTGYLTRRYGLTVDNLLEADVVLADGSFVNASKNQHPDLFWALRGGGIDSDPKRADALKTWGRAYWKAIHPFNLEGAYVNFMMDDEVEGRVQATYGENYKRLASVKAKYDPKNLFRVNQNILPSAS